MVRIRFIIIYFISFVSINIDIMADEGMWVPLLLNKACFEQMKARGCLLTPDDLYSINHASIKNAVVLFDRGCSGVIVSEQGLLLTNYHCGNKYIQRHNSKEHDFLTDGFWAMSRQEELPNPTLTVSILVSMEDVTALILKGITDTTRELQRNLILLKNIETMEKEETEKRQSHRIVVKPLYNGNQFFLYEYEVFQDVRLVAAPPSGIGKFGGDSDNWTWPRHTGDFSVFRIYTDKNNHPAPYSPDNVPYKPKKFLPISTRGVEDNDFTMVYGYPASTQPFLTSMETEYLINTELPVLINLRIKRLSIISEAMEKDPLVRIQFSPRYYGISNSWKKWQGEVRGLTRANAVSIKKEQEAEFEEWINRSDSMKYKYGKVLDEFKRIFPQYAFYSLVNSYAGETFQSIDMLDFAGKFNSFIRNLPWEDSAQLRKQVTSYHNVLTTFYSNFNQTIDKKLFAIMMQSYYLNVDQRFQPEIFHELEKKYKGDFDRWANDIYSSSLFSNQLKLLKAIDHLTVRNAKKMLKDPAIIIYQSFGKVFNDKILVPFSRLTMLKDSVSRCYTAALMVKNKDKILYPEANQTLRFSYGRVEGYKVADAVDYLYYTTLNGVIQKDDSASYDFHVPQKLKELYSKSDYGPYADNNGKMRICFIASNHTSGGNSGSPVLNAKGELIGLNFDRNWEGTMNEVLYDPEQCRNISLDIRYLLFVVDKFAGAGYLLNEMKIVKD